MIRNKGNVVAFGFWLTASLGAVTLILSNMEPGLTARTLAFTAVTGITSFVLAVKWFGN